MPCEDVGAEADEDDASVSRLCSATRELRVAFAGGGGANVGGGDKGD